MNNFPLNRFAIHAATLSIPMAATPWTETSLPELPHQSYIGQYIVGFCILVGSMLVAIQMRSQLVYGNELGADFQPHYIQPMLIAGVCLVVTQTAGWFLWRRVLRSPRLRTRYTLLSLIGAAALTAVLTRVLFADTPRLQLVYFLVLT